MKKILLSLLMAPFLFSERTEELSISPKEEDNFISASFRLWIPNELEKTGDSPIAILVLLPGYNGNGLDLISNPIWRGIAIEKNWALLGCSIQSENGIVNYDQPHAGSGRALEEALLQLGKRFNVDLTKTKLLFFGHSAGGQFGFHFACWKPERTVGFVAVKGGCYNLDLITPEARKVPGLWIIGEKDEKWRQEAVKEIVREGKKEKAPWNFKIDPNTGHEIGKAESYGLNFFEKLDP